MKDALGHGSDAHQTGVNKVVRVSPHQSYKVIPSSIPGLQYVKDRITSNKYFSLQHAASGKKIGEWRNAPVTEKDKDFVSHIDGIMRQHGIDWTKSEADLGHELVAERGARVRNSLSSAMHRTDREYKIRSAK